LLLRRFREELERDAAVEDAVVRTVATAGATVGTSGLCVAVGFAALLFTPLVETRSIGIGGLVVVAVAVALALTLVPALLAVLGRRVARRGIAASAVGPSRGLSRDRAAVLWEHWARALTRRPGLALLAGGLTLACLTAPVAWLRVGLPARHWWPSQTEAGKGLDLLTRIGGAGAVQPVRIVVDWPDSVGSPPRRPRHWPARAFLSAATWLSTSTFRMTCWAECRYSWAWSSALRR